MIKSVVVFAVVLLAALASIPAQDRTTYENVVAGMRCSQNSRGELECDYRVGRSLHFSIVALGKRDASIYFYSASMEGDYFAVVALSEACVIVRPGRKASGSRKVDLAFVSPRTGKVYRTRQECTEAR